MSSSCSLKACGRSLMRIQYHMDAACKSAFRHLGEAVAVYPYLFLIGSFLVCGGLMFGIRHAFGTKMGADGFTPLDAPSLAEEKVWQRFLQRNIDGMREYAHKLAKRDTLKMPKPDKDEDRLSNYEVDEGRYDAVDQYYVGNFQSREDRTVFVTLTRLFGLFVMARDGGNILRKNDRVNFIVSTRQFVNHIRSGIVDEKTGFTYEDVCEGACKWNHQIEAFLSIYDTLQSNQNFQLTFPVMNILGKRTFIGSSIAGVKVDPDPDNSTIVEAKLISMNFGTTTRSRKKQNAYRRILRKVYDYIYLDGPNSMSNEFPMLRVHLRSRGAVDPMLVDASWQIVDQLPVIGLFVLAFTVLSTLTSHCVRNKTMLVLFSIGTPMLGTASAFGFMFYVGVGYNYLCLVTVFLSLGVGVDDIYLMLHAWGQSHEDYNERSVEKSKHPVLGKSPAKKRSVKERMGICYAESGPGITITSITNMAAFAIGSSSDAPDMHVFCLYTVVSVGMCFIFQFTIWGPFLAIAGYIEHDDRNSVLCCFKFGEETCGTMSSIYSSMIKVCNDLYNAAMQELVKAYMKPIAKYILLAMMLVYWGVSIYGMTLFRVKMGLAGSLPPTSASFDAVYVDENYRENGAHMLVNFVTDPGDLRDKSRVQDILYFFREIETASPLMIGHDSSFCWLQPYLNYLTFVSQTDPGSTRPVVDFSYKQIPNFLALTDNKAYSGQMFWDKDACKRNEPSCVKAFLCTTGFFYEEDSDAAIEQLRKLRQIASDHSNITASIYYHKSRTVDQIASLRPQTLKAIVYTLLAMLGVCVVFVPSPWSIAASAMAIVSINMGIIGLGQLWGTYLSPVASCAVVMSIGFSVDFTAHITYHYYKHKSQDKYVRLLESMHSVAWPMFQAGVTTAGSSILMSPVGADLIQVFMKIIVLVVVLGILHGLVVLPIVLVASPLKPFDMDAKNDHDQNSESKLEDGRDANASDAGGAVYENKGMPDDNTVAHGKLHENASVLPNGVNGLVRHNSSSLPDELKKGHMRQLSHGKNDGDVV